MDSTIAGNRFCNSSATVRMLLPPTTGVGMVTPFKFSAGISGNASMQVLGTDYAYEQGNIRCRNPQVGICAEDPLV